jgi:tripartite-type tricarboxylate transporter receptor subunit TctC
MKVKWLFVLLFSCLAVMVFAEGGQQKAYPSHAVEFVVPSGAGGGQDTMVRILQPLLEKEFGKPIRVSNVSGGAHTKGIIYSYSAPADGYMVHCESPSGIIADIFGKMPFKFIEEFVPLARIQADCGVLWVGSRGRFKTIQEIISFAKENPGKVTVGVATPGGVDDAAIGMFALQAGIELALVPIESGGERIASVIGGHVDLMYEEVSAVGDMIKSGDLTPVVVLRDERLNAPEFKDTPAAGELGIKGMDAFGTYRCFAVRKETPKEIQDYLVAALKKAYDSPEYQQWAKENVLDVVPGWMGPEELGKLWRDNLRDYTEVFTKLGRL